MNSPIASKDPADANGTQGAESMLTRTYSVQRVGNERSAADLRMQLRLRLAVVFRLAEMADVIQELLIPMASRDEATVQEAIARFRESLG